MPFSMPRCYQVVAIEFYQARKPYLRCIGLESHRVKCVDVKIDVVFGIGGSEESVGAEGC
jgi:hypothetical protein